LTKAIPKDLNARRGIEEVKRESYVSTPLGDLRATRKLLLLLSENQKYTPRTQYLARQEADYLTDVIAFRSLDVRLRRRHCRNRTAPWYGTWTRFDEDLSAWEEPYDDIL